MPYPKYKFHPTRGSVVVNDAAAERALGPGWADNPKDFEPKQPEVAKTTGAADEWAAVDRQAQEIAPMAEAEKPKPAAKKRAKSKIVAA